MNDNLLKRIQDWYISECNGDWEHSYGIKIDTLDNPGWSLIVNLEDTNLEFIEFNQELDNGDNDWFTIRVKNKLFEGFSDPNKLEFLLSIFLDELADKYRGKMILDFRSRPQEDQEWFIQNTWCDYCQKADIGLNNPIEYREKDIIYIAGTCKKCGNNVVSQISDKTVD